MSGITGHLSIIYSSENFGRFTQKKEIEFKNTTMSFRNIIPAFYQLGRPEGYSQLHFCDSWNVFGIITFN